MPSPDERAVLCLPLLPLLDPPLLLAPLAVEVALLAVDPVLQRPLDPLPPLCSKRTLH
jgi:hypothetical protein